jgi:hypothetical protein
VKKDKEKSSNDVADKNATVAERGRATEPQPKPLGTGASKVAQTEDSLNNIANVAEKVTPTEVIFFFLIFPWIACFQFCNTMKRCRIRRFW